MASQYPFFTDAAQGTEPGVSLQTFFSRFPKQEFWRFFIERIRYDLRPFVYRESFKIMGGKETVELSAIKSFVKQFRMRVRDLSSCGASFAADAISLFHAEDKMDDLVFDILESGSYGLGWINFEQSEPGYLKHVTEGFCFILDNLSTDAPLTNDFIKKLHEICTRDVKNMLEQVPGQFRTEIVSWSMTRTFDSLCGLTESITHLQLVEQKYQFPGTNLATKPKNGSVKCYSSFVGHDPRELANELMESVKNGGLVSYYTNEQPSTNNFLNDVTEHLLNELNSSLNKAATEKDKLKSIFTFIKYTVLHHPFTDGVGRTYSMILLQYLLMKEKLLPFLIVNSNIIPGFSVDELIECYLKGKEEMKRILNDPSYISSADFFDPNVSTEDILEKAPEKFKTLFQECLTVWSTKITECIEQCSPDATLTAGSQTQDFS
ncbi:hypothetical protein [Legionella sp. CNM-4043-24]|uniref:hypothetical protein n=1 Tax=Legionella sp. CNM-4043-24 TaxID=3421646 RepID=UPI00403B36C5